MAAPIKTKGNKLGSIRVLEDDNHFLVHIHPENRDRAKKIAGRQWDGERRAWVYPKDLKTYSALVDEFKRDADAFQIARPEIPQAASQPIDVTYEEIDEEADIIEIANVELTQIRERLVTLTEAALSQRQTLDQICDHQIEIAKCLAKVEPVAKTKVEKIVSLPEILNVEAPKERLLVEKVLVQVAFEVAKKSKSFGNWLNTCHPLEDPASFVQDTHEKLKQQLEKIAGEPNSDAHFSDIVRKVEQENLIFISPKDPVRLYQILSTLNGTRNRFSHPRGMFHRSERWARSILYLMNLALIWPKIMMEDDGEDK